MKIFGMDVTTFTGQLRILLSAIGGILIAVGVTNTGDWAQWSDVIVTVLGAVFTIGSSIWAAVHHTTAINPDVKTIP